MLTRNRATTATTRRRVGGEGERGWGRREAVGSERRIDAKTGERRSVKVHAKGKGKKLNRQGKGMNQQQISTPPIDPENEEFVLFARSKKSALKNWYPFTIMVGGSQANVLVKAKENEFTEKLTGNTLAKTLGATLYKEKGKVVDMVKERVPYLKNAKEVEFAFKIRNKDKPASWMFTDGVEAIPSEEDCKGVFDKAAEWAAQFQ
ncbi:hypothetical protein HOP50_02g19600 [Chloropicon primus]|uniref:Uncharacterized protein n=2 Tax=Chloropicon primus TaxID=1764295 RepID=A0A5B8MIF8_9CHLO|nr:hypothetical protein A3770_02p19630 [Chloropicon primus]UPQ98654.1 hypothetical protein HOP50_02g19600 [Chloropicon primus]|eukprot:QDZ19445.1 hypothetical protein A3770_02p19630 [Chloropicon primus]